MEFPLWVIRPVQWISKMSAIFRSRDRTLYGVMLNLDLRPLQGKIQLWQNVPQALWFTSVSDATQMSFMEPMDIPLVMTKWFGWPTGVLSGDRIYSVSYTHLRAHETVLDLVCRLLL